MAQQSCRSALTIAVAVFSAVVLSLVMSPLWQISLMVIAASLMAWRGLPTRHSSLMKVDSIFVACMLVFLLLVAVCVLFSDSIFAIFYQAGSLVFGGGHVVLPLLEPLLNGGVSNDQFLLGYAAARGSARNEMFSFAAYLGAVLRPDAPLYYALVATLAVFTPGFVLLTGIRGIWQQLSARPRVIAAIAGVNAVAVGMLAAAWINPVFSSAPHDVIALGLAVVGYIAVRSKRVPILLLVVVFSACGAILYSA